MKIQAQPMIAVKDMRVSTNWYATLLGLEPGHGGGLYEQMLSEGQLVLQLHDMEIEDEHGKFRDASVPVGNGALLWFAVADFDKVVEAAKRLKARVDLPPYINPMSKHWEIWLRDPDGYRVVVAANS